MMTPSGGDLPTESARKLPIARSARGLGKWFWRNYYVNRLHLQTRYLSGALKLQEPVIVFQFGKVGSTTMGRTLHQSGIPGPVFHVHFLNNIDRRHRQICREVGLTPSAYFARSDHLELSRYLLKEVRRGLGSKRWKIITLVRDPLRQRISSFFQLIDLILPDFQARYQSGALTLADLTARFLERQTPLDPVKDWFDTELKPVFGVDVFANSFSKSKGYEIYHGPRADVLLIRLENLNACASEALQSFLGLASVRLMKHNSAETKTYAAAYSQFQQQAVLPRWYVDAVYAEPSAWQFYTDAEIETFKAGYLRTTPIDTSSGADPPA